MKHYQPIESKPRNRDTRDGVAFYIRECLQYRIIEYHCDLDCLVWSVNFGNNKTKNFCVVYRHHSIKMRFFLNQKEKLLEFLRSLSNDTIICRDFNIDTIANSKEKKDYVTLLLAFDFKCQNFEPTRVTPPSSTCLDHVVTSYKVKTDTIQTTMSDHFTVLGTIRDC